MLDIFAQIRPKILRSLLANRSHHLGNTFYRIIFQSNWYIDRKRLHTDFSLVGPTQQTQTCVYKIYTMVDQRRRR